MGGHVRTGKSDPGWVRIALTIALVAVAGGLLTSGCGERSGDGTPFADGSGDAILSSGMAAMRGVQTLHLVGDLTVDGHPVGFDLDASRGGDCRGSLVVAGGTARVRATGGTTWLKPDRTFLDQGAPGQGGRIARALGDRWALYPPSVSVAGVCDLDRLLGRFGDASDTGGDTRTTGTEVVGGASAVRVVGTSDGDTVTAWVATGPVHYILRIEQQGSDATGSLTFSDFGEPVSVTAPDPADVVDLSSSDA